jgi:hypothetical protein
MPCYFDAFCPDLSEFLGTIPKERVMNAKIVKQPKTVAGKIRLLRAYLHHILRQLIEVLLR